MPRARNIKPSFFTNDELAEIPALGRLLFIALWTMADREGRMEDRPKRIKAEALPYDDCDANELLDQLAERGFIARYTVGETRLIQVVNFCKHQNPHVKEGPSQIPAPDKPGASPVQARSKASPKPEPTRLIPDSGFPLPDSPSLIPGSVPSGTDGGAVARSPRGARLPSDFPTPAEIDWCKKERPDLDTTRLRDKFRDYWCAVPGAKGRKADWPATWRNFVRSEFVPQARAAPKESKYKHVFEGLTGRSSKPEGYIDVIATEKRSIG
jgi:hypothetical protein